MQSIRGLVAVCLLASVAACSGGMIGGPERTLAEGEVVAALGPPAGRALTVETPAGSLRFTIGPVGAETPYQRDPAQTIGPPDDGALVGVTYERAVGSAPTSMRDTSGGAPVQPEIALLAGGTAYPLFDDPSAVESDQDGELPLSADLWVAVADADDLGVRVAFDGLVQEASFDSPVADPGVAAMLYAPADPLAARRQDCGTATLTGALLVRPPATCRVEVATVPWLPATGWVDSRERAWLVLRSLVDVGSFAIQGDAGEIVCRADTTSVTYRVDGQEPVVVRPLPGDGEPGAEEVVFEVDRVGSHELEVIASGVRASADDRCPDPVVRWTTTLG